MKVSAVIVNYKTPKLLLSCLESLKKEAPEVSDIIVVDNASHDNSLEILKERFPYVRRIASRINAGFAKGVNWGMTNARNPYVLILNPDIVVRPGSIQTLVNQIDQQKKVGIIAPQLRYPDGGLQYSCLRFQTPLFILARRSWFGKTKIGQNIMNRTQMADYDHSKPRDVDWVLGGCMLVNRRAVEEVGMLDERFWMYCEDMEWCRRFWHAGWRVRYEPNAVVVHHHRRQSAEQPGVRGLLSPLGRAHFTSGLKYFIKHIGNKRLLTEGQRHMQTQA
jgi:N-acetylglucosaminyl-diphospho-decaprenol L-rhamnosyltransferase